MRQHFDLKFHEESDRDSLLVQKLEPIIKGISRDFKGAREYKLCFCDYILGEGRGGSWR